MKDYLDKLEDIPKHLCGNCFSNSKLCLFCQGKFDEYKKNPQYIWDELPINCNFKGYIFLKTEEAKQKIRMKKEKILLLKVKLKEADGIKQKRILKEIEKNQKEIDTYKDFGSYSW